MKLLPQWLIACSTMIGVIVLCYHVFSPKDDPREVAMPAVIAPAEAVPVVIDLDPLLKPIETLEQSLAKFSSTLQRFNTTIVQYDFLQKEMERLARLDQALGMRLNLETAKMADLGEHGDKTLEELIGQIRQIQAQVQVESERRRETMLKLIAGLERELATSSIDEGAVRDAIGDIPAAHAPAPVVPDVLPPVSPGNED